MFWKGQFRSVRPQVARCTIRRARPSIEVLETREVLSGAAYLDPVAAGVTTRAILTVGDFVGSYPTTGIPDGLGAFDNGDGTFTLLMNHELGSTQGAVHDHGAVGAFVSEYVIDKSTLQVLSGQDLMQNVFLWDVANQRSNTFTTPFAFNRFCSADLPEVSAFYNAASGLGTQERIYMHGEEGGATGFQVATLVTGAEAGNAFVLGKFNLSTKGSGLIGVGAWENDLASHFDQ